MSTLLVIGGSGFFGKSILDMFQRGKLTHWNIDKVIAMSRSAKRLKIETPELVQGNVDLLELDITTTNSLPEADYIIHAAASTDAKNYLTAGEKERKNILAGTLNYCRLARANKKAKTLYISSGAIYGTQPSNISHLKESYQYSNPHDIPENKRDYTIAKRDAEQLIKEFCEEGMSVSIARCFSFVGPFLPLDSHFAIGNFIKNGLSHEEIKINAKNRVYRSYMHSDDLVIWMMTILENANKDCPIFNVGSDEEILIDELAKKIGSHFSQKIEFFMHNKEIIDRYVPCIKKAQEILGLELKFSLDESIEKTIKKLQEKTFD
jgi:nucleoside-diphosphate-sugar epimerase